MAIIDNHEKGIELILKYHGVTVTVTRDEVDYQCQFIFNDVENGIRLGDMEKILGEKSSLYSSYDEMSRSGITTLEHGEIVTASPSKYIAEKKYKVSIPKNDFQLPGAVYFLEEVNNDSKNWSSVPK